MANSYNNIGLIYHQLKEYSKSLEFYEKALKISEKAGLNRTIAGCLINLGNVNILLENYDVAISYFEAGLTLSQKLNVREWIKNAYQGLKEIYAIREDYKKAYEYQELYMEIKDEIFNLEKSKKIEEIHTKYEVEKKELNNKRLRQEMKLKNKELITLAKNTARHRKIINTLKKQLLIEGLGEQNKSKEDLEKKISKKMIKQIKAVLKDQKNWTIFKEQYDKIHNNFLQTLIDQFPGLTRQELKVCALTFLELSSKEIAGILFVEARTIKIYRNRIRKKLQLPPRTEIYPFLKMINQSKI
jgi:DNA-binding CsgD family transcriptional regulator/tetratricopeptide (TPR) repeat protein